MAYPKYSFKILIAIFCVIEVFTSEKNFFIKLRLFS